MNVGKISGSQLQQESVRHGSSTSNLEKSNLLVESKNLQTQTIKQKEQDSKEVGKEKAKELVQGLNDFLQPSKTNLKFEFHDKLDEYFLTIVDSKTKEVIKEIPPKKLLDIYASMMESLGFIVDKKI